MGKKTPEFYKNGFTLKRIHKNSVGYFYEMQLQSWACLECLQSGVNFILLQKISHTLSIMFLLLSE